MAIQQESSVSVDVFAQPKIRALEDYYIRQSAQDMVSKHLDDGLGRQEVEDQMRNRQLSLPLQLRINALAVFARQEETKLDTRQATAKLEAAAAGRSDFQDPKVLEMGRIRVMLHEAREALKPLTTFKTSSPKVVES